MRFLHMAYLVDLCEGENCMNKRLSKVLALLAVFCLITAFMPADTFAAAGDGVFWSASITDTMVSKTVKIGSPKSLSALGLSPRAIKDGSTSYSFTWTSSNTSIATVNASTGYVTGVSTGTAIITGYSSTYGSSLGQLTLIVFVTSDGLVDVSRILMKGDHDVTADAVFPAIIHYSESMEMYDLRTYGVDDTEDQMTSSIFAAYMATSRIFYFRGHGSKTSVVVDMAEDGSQKKFYASFVNTLPTDAFSYCELVLYDSCQTAKGGETAANLTTATANHGAQTVVGFEASVVNHEMDIWVEMFFSALANGKTVSAACAEATAYIERINNVQFINDDGIYGSTTYVIAGNKSNTFT